jgi:hypothetical protein
MFKMTPEVAADTGVHIGDGHLFIRQNGIDTDYIYDVTGNAVDDQLYLLSHVVPIVERAYGLHNFGVHLDRGRTWMYVKFQGKNMALFKHDVLGLPNGRKINLSIPIAIVDEPRLMKCCTREILATDGMLGFYTASKNCPHKYPRIQINMTAGTVIQQLANFLVRRFSMRVSCRMNARPASLNTRSRHVLQINRMEDIEKWRKEIGFSNPSHISRMMVFEQLGECPPETTIVDRLAFLAGCSRIVKAAEPIPRPAFQSVIAKINRQFGAPIEEPFSVVKRIQSINDRLQHLNRELPRIVES